MWLLDEPRLKTSDQLHESVDLKSVDSLGLLHYCIAVTTDATRSEDGVPAIHSTPFRQ